MKIFNLRCLQSVIHFLRVKLNYEWLKIDIAKSYTAIVEIKAHFFSDFNHFQMFKVSFLEI